MLKVTIFAGHDGQLPMDRCVYLTLFGGCDLTRPTIARQILARRQAEQQRRNQPATTAPGWSKPVFITIFGGVDINAPTLAAEFIDLREMLESGLLTLADWDRAMADLAGTDSGVIAFTIFAGFGECELPSEDAEVDSLAVQRHLGNIPESASQVLQYGIGQKDSERRATVRRAVLATA